ncbi:MAG: hypothetical protein AABW49_04325 [Nanoarchaeota archaeon]
MDNKLLTTAIKKLRSSKKRNFDQSVDIIINILQIDLKNPEHRVDTSALLPHGIGRPVKICGLVDKELSDASKKILDHTILKSDFSNLDKKNIKKLTEDYDYFIAQSTLMVDIAKVFGKILGSRGKMPNPKLGCVVPPTAKLDIVKDRLKKTVRLQIKKELIIKSVIGKESMSDDMLAQNAISIIEAITQALPHNKEDIGSIFLKFTMSNPVLVGEENE